MNFNDLTLDQRHRRVAAADAEQADLEKAQKQLDKDIHFCSSPSFAFFSRVM